MHRISPVRELRVEAIPTAVIRDVIPLSGLPKFVPAACGEVWDFFRKTPHFPRPGRHIAFYPDGQGTVEVGAEIPEPFVAAVGQERIRCSSLPAGAVAAVTFFGPYAGLAAAHAALREWFTGKGYPAATMAWEIYDHWDEAWNQDPSQIRTGVYHLLQPEAD